MAKRRQPPPEDPDPVHREMLEHLERNPPPRRPKRSRPTAPATPSPAPSRPRLMLRHLLRVTALHRLETFVRQHRLKGTGEVVVVVGKGHRSGEAGPVISPAVRAWCDEHPDLVLRWEFAPPAEGGTGALVLHLAPPPRD